MGNYRISRPQQHAPLQLVSLSFFVIMTFFVAGARNKEKVAQQLPGMMHHYRQCAEELQSEQFWEKKMDAVVGDRVNEVP